MIDYLYDNKTLFKESRNNIINIYTPARTGIKTNSFKEECICRAQQIYAKNPDIFLALSSGISSQVCLQSFIAAGLKPKILIIKFFDGRNDYDTRQAIQACYKYNLVPLIIDVLPNYIYSEIGEGLIQKYQIYNLFDLLVAYILETLGIQILLVDKLNIRRDIDPKQQWSLIINEGDFWTRRFNSINRGKEYIIDTFFTDLKPLVSFINIPIINEVVNCQHPGKISIQSSKKTALQFAGFEDLNPLKQTDSTFYFTGLRDTIADKITRGDLFENRKFYIPIHQYLNNGEKTLWQHI